MDQLETVFDINRILVTLFNSSESLRKEHNIDLVYETDAHIPKELRGDSAVLLRLLNQILSYVIKNCDRKEILLKLTAPEDFFFEEEISFRIKETGIPKEKVLAYMETSLSKDLETLNGKIVYRDDEFSDVSLSIPFKVNELGFRRHYRLPANNMLDKKVLILCESSQVAHSIKKLFEYFHYDVDVGLEAYIENGSDLTQYDIFLTEEKLNDGEIGALISQAQKLTELKLVILKGKEKVQQCQIKVISTYLSKPVTQKSIYDLIIKLFDPNFEEMIIEESVEPEKKEEIKQEVEPVKKDELRDTIEAKKQEKTVVLNVEEGNANAKRMGLNYQRELKNFLETFDRSDIYFREIVSQKSTTKIKEFCIDLEKQSKVIGAESMSNFADIVSLIFVYNKLDLLPIYPGRYHNELQKLVAEIKKHI